MDRNICFNCGGDYIKNGGTFVCENCGSHKPKAVSNEETTLLYTAFQKLRLAEFFEAEQEFDDIIRKYATSASAYWGRLLSRYGIKYEEDYDGRRIPTCYSASIESIFDASDYRKALEYANEKNRAFYQSQAEYIEKVRCEWVNKAAKEKPYDIFICFKDSDDALGLKRTPDSDELKELYVFLLKKGYRVFFSRESLDSKGGAKYEPYIFNALSTAKVMLVYGSSPDYINATWVKNEWTRYQKRIASGEKHPDSLIVAYKGFSPKELPLALSAAGRQHLDAGKASFYSDFLDAITPLLSEDASAKPAEPAKPAVKTAEPKPADAPAEGLRIRINKDGETCTVEGQGSCKKKSITIPAMIDGYRVTGIGTRTTDRYGKYISGFDADITEVIIPNSVTEIGNSTFSECTSLERVYIPDSVVSIGDSAFRGCVRLGTVVIPDSVKELGNNAFYACESLENVTLSQSLTCIGSKTFRDCMKLKSIEIPSSVTEIGNGAFEYCKKLEDIAIPSSVERIGSDVFYSCESLESVWISASVVGMGGYVFSKCPNLSSIQYSGSEFQWNRIEKSPQWKKNSSICTISFNEAVYIPASMRAPKASVGLSCKVNPDNKTCTVMGQGTCKDKRIVIPETIEGYRVTGIGTEKTDFFGNLITGFDQDVYEILIPSTVTAINEYAFSRCGLTSIRIPDSVTVIGDGAFQGCEKLTSVTLSASLLKINSGVFNGCTSLTGISVPMSVSCIETEAFKDCTSLESAVLSESMTSIEPFAFFGCMCLSEIKVPASVKTVGTEAFAECMSLETLRYGDTKKQWKRVKLGKNWKKSTLIKKIVCTDSEVKSLFG